MVPTLAVRIVTLYKITTAITSPYPRPAMAGCQEITLNIYKTKTMNSNLRKRKNWLPTVAGNLTELFY